MKEAGKASQHSRLTFYSQLWHLYTNAYPKLPPMTTKHSKGIVPQSTLNPEQLTTKLQSLVCT